jgi:hypothetical protein
MNVEFWYETLSAEDTIFSYDKSGIVETMTLLATPRNHR